MTRRLIVEWPDARPFIERGGAPIRLLAASDAPDPVLDHAINRDQLGHIDAVIGCGDLEPDYLAFLGDAFHAPVAYVRGNHDRGGAWARPSTPAPVPLQSGRLFDVGGITAVPLHWPGLGHEQALRDELRAWLDVFMAEVALLRRGPKDRSSPIIVVSHAPPRGVGDAAADPYHVGYAGYRWLLERHEPPLWLHGHTNPASVNDWRDELGPSKVLNVTGSALVELVPPGEESADDGRARSVA
jgi:hypothetical protein